MNELSSARWSRFADALTRLAGELPRKLDEINTEKMTRTEIELQRNRLLQEQNALLKQLVAEIAGRK